MKTVAVLTILSAGLLTSPAQAKQTAPAAQVVQGSASTGAPEKKICKRIVPTGTMLAQRFCLTKAEWRQFNDINGDNVDGMFRRRAGAVCRGSGALCAQ